LYYHLILEFKTSIQAPQRAWCSKVTIWDYISIISNRYASVVNHLTTPLVQKQNQTLLCSRH